MKKLVLGAMLAMGLCLANNVARAEDDAPPASGCCKGYYEKTIICYKQVCKECLVPVQVKKLCYRDDVRQVKTTVMVPKTFTQKCPKVTECPREEYRDVKKCRQVPVKMMDPCTGCCIITYKNEYYTAKVKYVVMEHKTCMVDVTVCRNVPEERIVHEKCKVPYYTTETVMQKKLECHMVPYQKTVRVACPSPESGNYRVEVPLNPTSPPPALPPAPKYPN